MAKYIKNIKDILLIIGIIISLVVSALSFYFKDIERRSRLLAQERLLEEKTAYTKTEQKLSLAEKERDDLDKRFKLIKQEASSLEAELRERKVEISSTRRRISGLGAKATGLKEKIKVVEARIAELQNRTADVTDNTLQLKEELSLLQKTRDALRERLAQYHKKQTAVIGSNNKSLYLSGKTKEVSTAITQTPAEPVLIGEVLTVNREFGFIVTSLGRNDGIKEGMILDVSNDKRQLGEVEVETVRENISAASLVDEGLASQMRAGDKVILY